VPQTWPYLLGGVRSNAVFIGTSATEPQEIAADGAPEGWVWLRAEAELALAAGSHELVLKVSERGFAIDRIVLAADANFTPNDAGPAETRARD
jgi:hypothetical protein